MWCIDLPHAEQGHHHLPQEKHQLKTLILDLPSDCHCQIRGHVNYSRNYCHISSCYLSVSDLAKRSSGSWLCFDIVLVMSLVLQSESFGHCFGFSD